MRKFCPYRAEIIEKAGMVVGNIFAFLINSLSSVTKLTVNAVFSSVVMLYVMFYFLTMGEVLLGKILYFLPLNDRDERRLLQRFTSVDRRNHQGHVDHRCAAGPDLRDGVRPGRVFRARFSGGRSWR